jgi:hypothetical protein
MLEMKVAERKKVILAMMDLGDNLDMPQRKWPLSEGSQGGKFSRGIVQLEGNRADSPCTS